MNASPIAASISPRFDAKFIEEHHLVERYMEGKLPAKGARDLEDWCRRNPDYLTGLNLAQRAQSSLRLLEAVGRPLDLQEPQPPWWKSPYLPIGFGVLALLCLAAFWVLFGKYALLHSELEDAKVRMHQGSLVQPTTETDLHVTPDRAEGVDRAKITVTGSAPQLIDLHVDMSYLKAMLFRIVVDKKDQGRALIVNNVLKDSNGELRITLNTTGLSSGRYDVRIEALPTRGTTIPTPEGWLTLEVH